MYKKRIVAVLMAFLFCISTNARAEKDYLPWLPLLLGEKQTFTVTPSAGTNGSIVPNKPQEVYRNAQLEFTITPDASYYIVEPVGGNCPGILTGTTYTVGPIRSDCTVVASFQEPTIISRGLPTADINIVSGADRSNVAWTTYYFSMSNGDDFTMPSATNGWEISDLTVW